MKKYIFDVQKNPRGTIYLCLAEAHMRILYKSKILLFFHAFIMICLFLFTAMHEWHSLLCSDVLPPVQQKASLQKLQMYQECKTGKLIIQIIVALRSPHEVQSSTDIGYKTVISHLIPKLTAHFNCTVLQVPLTWQLGKCSL